MQKLSLKNKIFTKISQKNFLTYLLILSLSFIYFYILNLVPLHRFYVCKKHFNKLSCKLRFVFCNGSKTPKFLLNDKEMDKFAIHVNKVCLFLYLSRKSFFGGEKFNSRKAAFFISSITLKVIDKKTPNFKPD
jgi:hypothetical protein